MPKFLDKFQNRIGVLLAAGIMIPTALISSYTIHSSTQELIKSVSEQMVLEGNNSQKSMNLLVNILKADVLYLSQTPPIQGIVRARENKGIDPLDESTYQSWVNRLNIIFTSFSQARLYYYQIRYLDENGRELVRINRRNQVTEIVPANQLKNKANTDYFKATMQLAKDEIHVSAANLNREDGKIESPQVPVMRIATPIYNEKGVKRGILVANVLAESLFEIGKNDDSILNFRQNFYIINRNGYYLYHPDRNKTWGFDLNRPDKFQQDHPSNVSQTVFSRPNGLINEQNYLMSFYQVIPDRKNLESSFILLYKTARHDIYKSIYGMQIFSFLLTLACLAAGLAIAVWVLRGLVHSIQTMTGTVSVFSEQLSSTLEQQEKMSSQQSSSVHQTTVTMDELNVSSQQSARQADTVAQLAQNSLHQVEEGKEAIGLAVTEMQTVKQRVEDIANQALHLGQQTHQIRIISDLVVSLASQTNMLALNAAIEAVRAGENGKGFSVVASEIRKLADESGNSAQKIILLVQDIQNAVHGMVKVTEVGGKSMQNGVEMSQQTAQIFANISESVETIVANIQSIALTSQQQAMATQQVTDAMENLTQGASETAEGMTQIRVGTKELKEMVSKLNQFI